MRRWLAPIAFTAVALVACNPTSPATLSQAPPTVASTASPAVTLASTPESTAAPSAAGTSTAAAAPGTALATLAHLAVKGRAPLTGYSRATFGPTWQDVDHNGCDTRNDILRRDLTATRLSGSCIVLSGILHDPYTGNVIAFRRGVGTSTAVQIDHVVALGDAWQTGAQQLSAGTLLDLANDPLELLAVDGPTNERKGDADAASWLPPNKAFRCQYVARQIAVKAKYHFWVTAAERSAMTTILSGCRNQVLPTGGLPVHLLAAGHPSAAARPSTKPPTPTDVPIVHPGTFCTPPGALGVTDRGTPMICKLDSKGLRYRWGQR